MNDQMNAPIPPPPPAPVQPTSTGNAQMLAIISLIAGVISLCGMVIPVFGWIIGVPLAILGLVLGYYGRRDVAWRTLSTVGMVVSGISFLLLCGTVGVISVMRLLGPKIGETFSTISNSLP